MDKDLSDSASENSPNSRESETEKSFVGKFKSHVSEIINSTPLSKWFRRPQQQDDGEVVSSRSTIRRRNDSFEDEEIFSMQPPSKRPKRPSESHNIDNNYNQLLTVPPVAPTAQSSQSKQFTSFPEPVAGPSGIQSRKLLSRTANTAPVGSTDIGSKTRGSFNAPEFTNGHHHHSKDSDSEESTSGYSSVARIGSKEQVCGSRESSKQASPLENSPTNSRTLFREKADSTTMSRSLFAEHSISPNLNSSLSSRRPSFNASTFGSPNFVDKTLSTRRILNSPFYTGHTIYGGASAYGKTLGRSVQDLRQNLRQAVTINPKAHSSADSLIGQSNITLGKTARRILDTLEQYNSPVNDAKKIPVVSKRYEGILSKYTGANPYLVREKKVASNKELQVPSVTDLLKLKQRERLQNSTESVRQMASSTKSSLNAPAQPETYQLAKNQTKPKHVNKIKSSVAAIRQKSSQNEESVAEVPLPAVSLPITNLPKFDLKIPPPASTVGAATPSIATTTNSSSFVVNSALSKNMEPKSSQLLTNKQTEINSILENSDKNAMADGAKVIEYKFAKPLIIAENLKSIVAINNFQFSKPNVIKANAAKQLGNDMNFKMPDAKMPVLKEKPADKKLGSELKTSGSVMDVLSKSAATNGPSLVDKFKPAEGTWECSTCLVRNSADKTKCAACETPKSKPVQNDVKNGFGSQFFLSASKWECQACLVRNESSTKVCVACTTPKGGAASDQNKLKSFGDKFKPPSDTWECGSCMVRNKMELNKCVACETPKAGAATTKLPELIKFKPPADTWECSACMIHNKNSLNKCAACETPKASDAPGFGSEFKLKNNEWECSSCMVRNKADAANCQCCQAANPNKKSNGSDANMAPAAPVFKFGIPVGAQVENTTNTNVKSIFGAQNISNAATPTATFSFGIKSTTETKTTSTDSSTTEKTLEAPKTSLATPKSDDNSKPASANVPTFNFGSKTDADTQKVGFSFGAPPTTKTEMTSSSTSNTTETKTNKPTFTFGSSNINNSLTAPVSSSSGFTFKSTTDGKSANEWTCTKCKAQVKNDLNACSACQTPKEGVSLVASFEAKPTPAAPLNFNLGDKFKPNSNTWECSTCMIRNKDDLTKCAACEAPKPEKTNTNPPSFGTPCGFSFNSTNNKPEASVAPAAASDSKPVFQFGAKSLGQTTMFASNTTSQANNIVKPTPTFGAATQSNTTPASQQSSFSFSSNATTQQKPFSFGAANNEGEPPNKIPSFSFAQTPAAAGASTTVSKPAAPSGGFNFGSSTSSPAAPAFNFTAPATKPDQQGTFNAPATGNLFGQNMGPAKNGTFNFGSAASSAAPQKAGFSFGASPQATPAAPQSTQQSNSQMPMFNFGSAAAGVTNTSSTGFNFSAAPPVFDANVKPSFNFTDGSVTTFAAQPTEAAGITPQRKIRKALRRTQR